jgi:GrpB-like predicted nucleotidyltransferase (UPF0157 family)
MRSVLAVDDQWRIAEYDPEWKRLFNDVGSRLRDILQKAHLWSQAVGWKPGESDA